MLTPDSILEFSLLVVERDSAAPPAADEEVLRLFDRHAPALLRYVASFGLREEEAEDVVQDVFLALFRHLLLERSRRNLTGWLFRVAHNLALKRRKRIRRRGDAPWDQALDVRADATPNAEAQLMLHQRRQRLTPVIRALPPRDRRCLVLRAEGLRYRDIAQALGMSLGGVAKSLTRSIARLVNADRG